MAKIWGLVSATFHPWKKKKEKKRRAEEEEILEDELNRLTENE